MTPQKIKTTCERLWNSSLINAANRNIFTENMEIKTGAPVNPKSDKVAQARMRQCASLGDDRAKAAKLAEAEIVGKDKNGKPLYKFTHSSTTPAERQARSRANRAAEGGKAFTVFLGRAEVRALEKIKAKLGTDDASAIIRDALLTMAWSP